MFDTVEKRCLVMDEVWTRRLDPSEAVELPPRVVNAARGGGSAK